MKNKLYSILQLLFILSIISCAKKVDAVQPISKDNRNSCETKLLRLIKESDFHPNEINYFVRAEEIRNDTIIIKAFVENNLSDNNKNKEIVKSVVSWFIIPPQHDGVYLSFNALDPVDPKFKKLKIKENFLSEFLSCYLKSQTSNPPKKNMEFENLFNENSIIKFTPKDLNKKVPEIEEFKRKLNLYEEQHPLIEDFRAEDLLGLINDKTFFDLQHYTDSSWLQYFISKYKIEISKQHNLMKQAIEQEDYNTVKVIINNGYIISKKDLEVITETKENIKTKLQSNKTDGYVSYISTNSKIDEITKYLSNKYILNKVNDPDGYTNLRKEKNTSSDILQKVKSGEHIEVLDNSGEWFLVKTKEGKQGYIHKSRIKSE